MHASTTEAADRKTVLSGGINLSLMLMYAAFTYHVAEIRASEAVLTS